MNYDRNIKIMAQVVNATDSEMLRSRRYPLAQLRALLAGDLYNEGLTKREIGAVLHKDRTTVHYLILEAEQIRQKENGFNRVIKLYAEYQEKLLAEDLSKQEVIDILSRFNEYIRYEGELGKRPQLDEPRMICVAIDKAIKYIKG